MKKALISIIVIVVMTFIFIEVSRPESGDFQGKVRVVVIDAQGVMVIDDELTFSSEISLFALLQEHYQIGCANMNYQIDTTCGFKQLNSHILLSIEDVETNWTGSYLQIFVNGERSDKGVDLIMLEDQNEYTFKYTSLGGE